MLFQARLSCHVAHPSHVRPSSTASVGCIRNGQDKTEKCKVCSCEALISYLSVLIFSSIKTFDLCPTGFRALRATYFGGGGEASAPIETKEKRQESSPAVLKFSTEQMERNATQRKEMKMVSWDSHRQPCCSSSPLGSSQTPPKQNGRRRTFVRMTIACPSRMSLVVVIIFSPGPFTSFFLVHTVP